MQIELTQLKMSMRLKMNETFYFFHFSRPKFRENIDCLLIIFLPSTNNYFFGPAQALWKKLT